MRNKDRKTNLTPEEIKEIMDRLEEIKKKQAQDQQDGRQ